MNLPPLKALPVFEAVARLNGFSRASAELNISQSAVSHQIRQLEDYLGEPLFLRGGRKVSLTPEGSRYLEVVTSALGQIERASRTIQGDPGTRLRLAVPSSFAVCWLIPRMEGFRRQHPDLDVALEMLSDMPPMSDRLADCFIAISPRQRGYESESFYRERLFPLCTRQFWHKLCDDLRSAGLIGENDPVRIAPEWLARFPLLSATSIFEQPGEDWRRWFKAVGLKQPDSTRVQHFSHMLMAHEAARHHQGIVLSNDYMLDPQSGQDWVILPCGDFLTGDEFHFAWKAGRRNEPAIRIIRGWVRDQARRSGLSGV